MQDHPAEAGGTHGTPAGDIARAVRCPPSTLSFHLKELTRCGLLRAAQQGRFIRYAVDPAAFAALGEYIGALAGSGAAAARPPAATRGHEQLSMFSDQGAAAVSCAPAVPSTR